MVARRDGDSTQGSHGSKLSAPPLNYPTSRKFINRLIRRTVKPMRTQSPVFYYVVANAHKSVMIAQWENE